MSLAKPIQTNERAAILDVLRGFAIFGIFIMNLYAFSFGWAMSPEQKAALTLARFDGTTMFIQHMFFEGKFYSLFSMLFGIGFSIYLAKTDLDKNILGLFKRRLLILLGIGFLHLLLWTGDIVAFYAMLGFVLIPFRKFSNKTLLIIAACFILSPILWYSLKFWKPEIFDLSRWLYKSGEYLEAKAGYHSLNEVIKDLSGDNIFKMIKLNLIGIFWRYGDLVFQSRAFKVLGMFLIGLVIGRTQLYNKLKENKKLLWKIAAAGLVIGLPANYILASLNEIHSEEVFSMHGLKETIAYAFGVAPLALGYAAAISLLYLSPAQKIFNLLAPVGRMALTNYITHTLIGLFVFTKLGLDVTNWGPAACSIFAVAVFLLQIMLSTAWLKYFNYGPLEWIWRMLTYGHRLPILKTEIRD
ncbi:MAG: DUF418 domain-containing protein [Ferruginibacter sp.]